ncbi:MAG: hypothetical protein ACYC9Z_01605 [Casimicrobiaceae bacterium]
MNYEELRDDFAARDFNRLRDGIRAALNTGSYDCLMHPLGFYFTRLAVQDKSSFRLHYWRANDRGGTAITPYHDHVWQLCSCVLVGELNNVLLDVEEDTSGTYTIAEIKQIGGVDEVVPGKQSMAIRVKSRERHRCGDFYEVEPRVFHYTDIQPDATVVTVVRSDVVVEGKPRTLMPLGSDGHAPARIPIANFEQVVGEVIQLLVT